MVNLLYAAYRYDDLDDEDVAEEYTDLSHSNIDSDRYNDDFYFRQRGKRSFKALMPNPYKDFGGHNGTRQRHERNSDQDYYYYDEYGYDYDIKVRYSCIQPC